MGTKAMATEHHPESPCIGCFWDDNHNLNKCYYCGMPGCYKWQTWFRNRWCLFQEQMKEAKVEE